MIRRRKQQNKPVADALLEAELEAERPICVSCVVAPLDAHRAFRQRWRWIVCASSFCCSRQIQWPRRDSAAKWVALIEQLQPNNDTVAETVNDTYTSLVSPRGIAVRARL